MEPYKKRGMQFLVMLLFVSIITIFTTTSAQAATKKNGFVTSGRQTYYVRNGTKVRYSGYTKYNYHTTSGNYIRNGKYLRWNRSTLADPNGYMNKTANQILADLFR